MAINKAGYEDGVATILESYPEATVPILQDHGDADVFWNCGASKYFFYVLDGERNVVFAHYALTVEDEDGEGQRLIDEIDVVVGGAR